MKQQNARSAASAAAAVFATMLLLSACQKAPDLMTMIPGNAADHTTAPAAGTEDHRAPALRPYDPTRSPPPNRSNFPSTRPRPGMPHPSFVKEAKSDTAARLGRSLPPPTIHSDRAG